MARDKYKISLWEDILIPATLGYFKIDYSLVEGEGIDPIQVYYEHLQDWFTIYEEEYVTLQYYEETTNDSNFARVKDNGVFYRDIKVPEHYEEKKVVDIGSDTLTDACRAYEPKLVENINGTNTFTFKMFYVYRDEMTGEKRQNPFLSLLVNERKVKVYWKDKWYDFIIKDIQEDSSGKSITYTCKDAFINELSKNGFNITLDQELQNNQGTALELATRVVDQTDWKVVDEENKVLCVKKVSEAGIPGGKEVEVVKQTNEVVVGLNSDTVKQYKEEPVFESALLRNFGASAAINQETGLNPDPGLPAGKIILFFYSSIRKVIDKIKAGQNSGTDELYFAYADEYQTEDKNSQLVVNADSYKVTTGIWVYANSHITFGNDPWARLPYNKDISEPEISPRYRAKNLIDSDNMFYDPITKKYVTAYKYTNNGTTQPDLYGYTSTDYKLPTTITNYLVNSSNFTSLNGWTFRGEAPSMKILPNLSDPDALNCFEIKTGGSSSVAFKNAGLQQMRYLFKDGLIEGKRYVFEWGQYENNINLVPRIWKDRTEAGEENKSVITFVSGSLVQLEKKGHEVRQRAIYKCGKTVTYNELLNKEYNFYFRLNSDVTSGTIRLSSVALYEEVLDSQGQIVTPTSINTDSIVTTYYNYYLPGAKTAEEVKYVYQATEPMTGIVPIKNNYKKIRSIQAKESNRFNILQSIAETFECWIRFHTFHNNDGTLQYNEDGTPKKYITIKNEVGQETGIGFIYGIDLKAISRSIQSDQIVTKTIVPSNSNEFGKDGFCTIARSDQNYPRAGFILNFDYYLSHKLLGQDIYKDLYMSTPDCIGYYYHLHEINTEYDKDTDSLVALTREQDSLEASRITYETTLTSAQAELASLEALIMQWTNTSSITAAIVEAGTEENLDNEVLQTKIKTRISVKKIIENCEGILDDIYDRKAVVDQEIEELEEGLDVYKEQIKELDLKFYKKYSAYIQEGSWKSDEYMDDDLYYMDALAVSYTSSRPQVSYNVSVARISSIEEFKSKVFRLGDITYIQDVEFFGYRTDTNIRTPYREKVLVSEITSNFDSPEQDSFKIQNYKTQFEDLFQRITATTQSLQYASGEYTKVASIITPEGNIKAETLQSSIDVNNNLVRSSNNQSVIEDSTGITVSDLTDPSQKTKITSGGLFISTDGGATWKNAIRGEGVATQYLTSGLINTEQISIMSGKFPTFKWDSVGLSAYDQLSNDGGINYSKFVRFDRFGVYGINGNQYFEPTGLSDIRNNADFGLTWDGFFLKSKGNGGSIEISTDNDFEVKDGDITRIKIGRIPRNELGPVYRVITAEERSQGPVSGQTYYVDNDGQKVAANLYVFEQGETYYKDGFNAVEVTKISGSNINVFDADKTTTYYKEIDNQYVPGVVTGFYVKESDLDHSGGAVITIDGFYLINNKKIFPYDQAQTIEGFIGDSQELVEFIYCGTILPSNNINDIDFYIIDSSEESTTQDGEDIFKLREAINTDFVQYYIDNGKVVVTEAHPDMVSTYYTLENNEYVVVDSFNRAFDDQTTYYVLEKDLYGIRINNASGNSVMETGGDGELWLKKNLHIGTSNGSGYLAEIGYLDAVATNQIVWIRPDGTSFNLDTRSYVPNDNTKLIHRSLNINNKFVVWEDGTIYAKDGYFEGTVNATNGVFTGTINATSGNFSESITVGGPGPGGITLGQIKESAYRVIITSSAGEIFKDGHIITILTANLYKGASLVDTGITGYQWYENNIELTGKTSQTLSINETLSDMETVVYTCEVEYGA